MNKKVVILNGPPSAGKDTLADHLVHNHFNVHKKEFKQHLFALTKGIFRITDKQLKGLYVEGVKEKPSPLLKITMSNSDIILFRKVSGINLIDQDRAESRDLDLNGLFTFNLSIREALIYVSEVICKPRFGQDYFGLQAAKNLSEGLNVFSDGGFVEELLPVIKEVGSDNVLVIRISRKGCSFLGDSRDYLPDDLTKNVINLYNNKSLEDFFEESKDLITKHLDVNLLKEAF